MTSSDYIILSFAAAIDAAWVVSLWRRWPERVYERMRDSRSAWFWLDVFGIHRSERNCVQFIRAVCIAGMILVTLGTLFVVIFRHR
jgi:hypothetical protein